MATNTVDINTYSYIDYFESFMSDITKPLNVYGFMADVYYLPDASSQVISSENIHKILFNESDIPTDYLDKNGDPIYYIVGSDINTRLKGISSRSVKLVAPFFVDVLNNSLNIKIDTTKLNTSPLISVDAIVLRYSTMDPQLISNSNKIAAIVIPDPNKLKFDAQDGIINQYIRLDLSDINVNCKFISTYIEIPITVTSENDKLSLIKKSSQNTMNTALEHSHYSVPDVTAQGTVYSSHYPFNASRLVDNYYENNVGIKLLNNINIASNTLDYKNTKYIIDKDAGKTINIQGTDTSIFYPKVKYDIFGNLYINNSNFNEENTSVELVNTNKSLNWEHPDDFNEDIYTVNSSKLLNGLNNVNIEEVYYMNDFKVRLLGAKIEDYTISATFSAENTTYKYQVPNININNVKPGDWIDPDDHSKGKYPATWSELTGSTDTEKLQSLESHPGWYRDFGSQDTETLKYSNKYKVLGREAHSTGKPALNALVLDDPEDVENRQLGTVDLTEYFPAMNGANSGDASSTYYEADWDGNMESYKTHPKISEGAIPFMHAQLIKFGKLPGNVLPDIKNNSIINGIVRNGDAWDPDNPTYDMVDTTKLVEAIKAAEVGQSVLVADGMTSSSGSKPDNGDYIGTYYAEITNNMDELNHYELWEDEEYRKEHDVPSGCFRLFLGQLYSCSENLDTSEYAFRYDDSSLLPGKHTEFSEYILMNAEYATNAAKWTNPRNIKVDVGDKDSTKGNTISWRGIDGSDNYNFQLPSSLDTTINDVDIDENNNNIVLTDVNGNTYTAPLNKTSGDNSENKLFLVGMTSQTKDNTANQTYTNKDVYAENGALYATSVESTSARSKKKDISKFKRSGLDMINNTDIVNFRYKAQGDNAPLHVGFIADDTDELLAPEHSHMDYTNCIGVLMKAVQELDKKVEKVKKVKNVNKNENIFKRLFKKRSNSKNDKKVK